MNFFERQQSARRTSLFLRIKFALLVAIGILPLALAVAVGTVLVPSDAVREFFLPAILFGAYARGSLSDPAVAWPVVTLLVCATGLMLLIVFGLRERWQQPGTRLAKILKATPLQHGAANPRHLTLRNVVEEMSLAAGIPMPSVYVLEDNDSINALSAGQTISDAAIFVTQGALDYLTRDELQGIIAHEFSHILNGDMTINVRLLAHMGVFMIVPWVGLGLLGLLFAGKRLSDRFWMFLIWLIVLPLGLILTITGLTQLLLASLLRSGVGRQREMLADASAVQFTRNPQGLTGALLKIAALGRSAVKPTAGMRQAAHMCFASVSPRRWFDTHPPLAERLIAIDPQFPTAGIEDAIDSAAAYLQRRRQHREDEHHRKERNQKQRRKTQIVLETLASVATADALAEGAKHEPADPATRIRSKPAAPMTPRPTSTASADRQAAALTNVNLQDSGSACSLILALLLDRDEQIRHRQLALIAERIGPLMASAVLNHEEFASTLAPSQRMPLVDRALPTLRNMNRDEARKLLDTIKRLALLDGQVDVFEYALARSTAVFLKDLLTPPGDPHGNLTLTDVAPALGTVFSVLAQHGHADAKEAQEAYEIGMQMLLPRKRPSFRALPAWVKPLDTALASLDRLQPIAKELVIEAMTKVVRHDRLLNVDESELIRAIARALHCPLSPSSAPRDPVQA